MRGREFVTRKLGSTRWTLSQETQSSQTVGEGSIYYLQQGETLGNLPQSSKNGDIFKAKGMSIFIKRVGWVHVYSLRGGVEWCVCIHEGVGLSGICIFMKRVEQR